MKFSVQWLQEWLDSPVDANTLATTFTMSGLEVESLEPAAAEFSGVVIGLVETEAMHPDAKRLHCCRVNIGKAQPLSIVCGGVNVRPGLKVALATVGAKLPGGLEIKDSVLRGEPSQGMICSARELGLGEDKEGCILELPADAPLGQDVREYLALNDHVIDIALTANRGDCLSIMGIARESSALLKVNNRSPKMPVVAPTINDTLKIELAAPQMCPRYLGRIIRNINLHVSTPVWMQERLRRSGIRSIHPVVDVTNYVMLELGQPLHAFNLENITAEIQVRLAKPGETLTLLDGRVLNLTAQDLVIADRDQPLALAGIMGGVASGVAANTHHLFLESAFFTPVPLSLTARRHSLQTDSSYRFARGVDFELPLKAIERATQLLVEIVGGEAGPVVEKVDKQCLPKPATILLRRAQILRLLGIELSNQQVTQILQSLGMVVTEQSDGWQVQAPSYRYDLTLEVDLIEELGRLHGYHNIPLQTMSVAMQAPQQSETQLSQSRLLSLWVDRGYWEAITYSFVSPRWQEWLDPDQTPIALANPISSDMSVMRTSLWPGLLQALQYNQNRQIPRVRLFETGLCFLLPPAEALAEKNSTLRDGGSGEEKAERLPPDSEHRLCRAQDKNRKPLPLYSAAMAEKPQQIAMLGGVVSGSVYPEQWGVPSRPVDFFDVKADIEALLALSGQSQRYSWQSAQHPALHPGQSAELLCGEQVVGRLGALHPQIAEKCGVGAATYLFELNLDMIKNRQLNEFKQISKFPGVRRDLAILVTQTTPAGAIEKFILEKAGKLLNNVQIFDVYQGQHIEKGQKSIALALTFQEATRTLKDEEIQVLVDNLIKGLEQEFNAKLRE